MHIIAACDEPLGSRPSKRQVVRISAQTGESAGNERRAGLGVTDAWSCESLGVLERWEGVWR